MLVVYWPDVSLKVIAIEADCVGIKHILCVSAFGINYICLPELFVSD